MKRYCIENDFHEMERDCIGNDSHMRIAPFVLRDVLRNYTPTKDLNETREEETPLPDSVRNQMMEFTLEVNGLTKEKYDKNIYDNYKDNLPMFPECESAIIRLINKSLTPECEVTSREEEMYEDILQDIFSTVFIELDMCLHIYYTLLYENNKDKYVSLAEENWTKDQKEEIRSKRKECKRTLNTGKRIKLPFEIIEKENVKESNAGKIYYDATTIQDFAPNICRLYYLSPEFRNIFTAVKKLYVKKYEFSEIKKIFQEVNVKRKEEIWLCEKMLGINLSLAFYSFFSVILKDINYTTIEKEHAEVIQGIIKEVMSLDGIYSRCAIVHKLKIIYELRKKYNLYTPYDRTENHLDYLYKQVLCKYMPECVKRYKYMECYALEKYEKDEIDRALAIEKLEEDCEILFSKYFEFIEGYYMIEELSKEIKDEKLYALIQNLIINNK